LKKSLSVLKLADAKFFLLLFLLLANSLLAGNADLPSDSTLQKQQSSGKLYISEGTYVHNLEAITTAEVVYVKKNTSNFKKLKKRNTSIQTVSSHKINTSLKEIKSNQKLIPNKEAFEFLRYSQKDSMTTVMQNYNFAKWKVAIVLLAIMLFLFFIAYKHSLYFSKYIFLKNFLLKQSFSRPPPYNY